MASLVKFSNFTFTAEQIRRVSELMFDAVVNGKGIDEIATIYPGIVYDKEIGFVGEFGLLGVADQGCDPTAQTAEISTRKLTWQPKGWEIFLKECYSNLESTAAVYSLHTGTKVSDFTDTDYEAIVLDRLSLGVNKMVNRIAFFGDEDAATAGELGTDSNAPYFNLINGVFKQLATITTSDTSKRVTISENAGASYAAQKITPANVITYLSNLVFGADVKLKSQPDQEILVTQSVYDAYNQYLIQNGNYVVNGEAPKGVLQTGVSTPLYFNNIPVIAMPEWDEIIKTYFNNGTKFVNPNRAIYTCKANLAIGVDAEGSFDEIKVWDEYKERAVYTDVQGKIDAKVLNPALVMYAY